MIDISKNILEKPARRWRVIRPVDGRVLVADHGEPNWPVSCTRRFTSDLDVEIMVLFTIVHGITLMFDTWYDLLLESGQSIDFRHVTGLVDGIGVSELWAVDRLASRDDRPAMLARKQFTPAQRAVVAEWHKRELAMLAQERA